MSISEIFTVIGSLAAVTSLCLQIAEYYEKKNDRLSTTKQRSYFAHLVGQPSSVILFTSLLQHIRGCVQLFFSILGSTNRILHHLPAVICGTIVNFCFGYLIVPVYSQSHCPVQLRIFFHAHARSPSAEERQTMYYFINLQHCPGARHLGHNRPHGHRSTE